MKRQSRPVFWRTLRLNFIIVLAITICLIGLSFSMRYALQANEEDGCAATLRFGLEQTSAQIQAASDSVIAFRESVTRTNAYGLRRYDAVNLLRARDALATIVSNNTLVGEVAYVYEDRDMVITSRSIYYSIDSFLKMYEIKGMDLSRFYDYVGDGAGKLAIFCYLPCESISSRDGGFIQTAFCCALPLDTEWHTTRKGVVYVFLKLDELLSVTISERIRPYAALYLYDRRGGNEHGVCLVNEEGAFSGGNSFTEDIVNSRGTLRAEIHISNRYIDGQMRIVNRYIVGILLAAMLAGVGMALWTAYRQYQPMNQAIRRLREQGLLILRDQDEYTALMDSMESLASEKESVSLQMNRYQASLHRNMLDRLFFGTALRRDMEETLRVELEDFPEKSLVYCGQIFIASSDRSLDLEMAAMMVVEYLSKHLPDGALLHSTDSMGFALIYPCEEGIEAAERELAALLDGVSERFAARVILTLGGFCEGMSRVGLLFERARNLAGLAQSSPGQRIVHPEDVEDQDQSLRLRPLQMLHQFMAAGDSGNALEAMKSFFFCPADMMQINLRERYETLRTFVMVTAREVAPGMPPLQIRRDYASEGAGGQLTSLEAAVRAVCDAVNARQTDRENDQFREYAEYLRTHYQDPDMCAAMLANVFRVSEKAMFSLFKKRTGSSPTAFLHHFRMEEAARMLRECDDTAQKISMKVGFVNFGTFYKAFKREYGVAPGLYREIHQSGVPDAKGD